MAPIDENDGSSAGDQVQQQSTRWQWSSNKGPVLI